MSRNIKSICPDISRKVQVLDDWNPSFYKKNKLYVYAEIIAVDAGSNKFMKSIYGGVFRDSDGNEYRYCAAALYGGDDGIMLKKAYLTNDVEEAIKHYRRFKKLLNRLQKTHPRDLRSYLYDIGFTPL